MEPHEHNFQYRGRDDMFAILMCKCGETKLIDIVDWLDEEEYERMQDEEGGWYDEDEDPNDSRNL